MLPRVMRGRNPGACPMPTRGAGAPSGVSQPPGGGRCPHVDGLRRLPGLRRPPDGQRRDEGIGAGPQWGRPRCARRTVGTDSRPWLVGEALQWASRRELRPRAPLRHCVPCQRPAAAGRCASRARARFFAVKPAAVYGRRPARKPRCAGPASAETFGTRCAYFAPKLSPPRPSGWRFVLLPDRHFVPSRQRNERERDRT